MFHLPEKLKQSFSWVDWSVNGFAVGAHSGLTRIVQLDCDHELIVPPRPRRATDRTLPFGGPGMQGGVGSIWGNAVCQKQQDCEPSLVTRGRIELTWVDFRSSILGVRCFPLFIGPCHLCGYLHGCSWPMGTSRTLAAYVKLCPFSPERWLAPFPTDTWEGAGSYDPDCFRFC